MMASPVGQAFLVLLASANALQWDSGLRSRSARVQLARGGAAAPRMGEVPKDLKAIGRLLRGERPKSWPAPGKLEWTIHAKTESGEVDYEKLLFFPLPGMKALCSALGFDALLGPFQPTSVTSGESVEAFETLAVTLGPDCTTKGVGLGLDPHNVIDMLVPGKTAADMLQIGDRIIQWNGRSLTDLRTGLPKKLASVVDSNLDTHAVVVERPRLTLSGAEKTALIMEATRRSGCETDGCEAGEIAGLAKRPAPAAEEATDSAFSAVESALRGEGLEVPAPKAALEKIVEEAKVVE